MRTEDWKEEGTVVPSAMFRIDKGINPYLFPQDLKLKLSLDG